ncbi:polyprenol monophosphomannose synthase [Janibacter massiliensis]|uniref:polyprenol monophosphomannose synthase n=1 Tax=Janibacter massiliensis TaxID=2058291 RepID=UPI001F43E360|nr:polyprenol monophosphomannose synthase [Janibacter massiliensis]
MPENARRARKPIQRAVVLVPTYNERENLPLIIERVRAAVPWLDVLVLDDNSPDGTGEVADEIAATDRQVHVLHRPGKQGLGAAYLAGFAWAAERGYDAMIEMDADGSHRPEHLPAMLDAATTADLVIGSRWVKGGETVNWPLSRQLISRGGSLYTRLLLGVPVHDCTAGFRVYRATALEKMALSDVASAGYCFQIDLTRRALDRGLTVVEVPISFVEREIGDSKMNGDIVREAMVRVGQWGVKHRAAQLGRLLGWRPGESWHDLT